jgi:hypothetical protein
MIVKLIFDLRDAIGVAKMSASVHGQGSSTTTESVTLRSVLASVAHLAEEFVLVSVGVGRIQKFVAQAFI